MKNILIIVSGLLFGCLSATAQGLYIQGDVFVATNETVTVEGNVHASGSATLENKGEIILSGTSDNWTNNASATFLSGSGTVTFDGSNLQTIAGTSSTNFNKLTINNGGAGVMLSQDIFVTADMHMMDGDVNLRNQHIELGLTGELIGETEFNRIKATDASGNEGMGTGTISASRNLFSATATNVGGLGLEITPPTDLGNTKIIRGHTAEQNQDFYPTGKSIFRYYEVLPTENPGANADLKFSFFNIELNGNYEPGLRMYQKNSSFSWDGLNGSSPSNQEVTASSNGLSTFRLAERWTTGVEDLLPSSTLSVYPNPVQGHTLNLLLNGLENQDVQLSLYNPLGQVILQKQIPGSISQGHHQIQIPAHLSQGAYLLKLSTEQGQLSRKIIVR